MTGCKPEAAAKAATPARTIPNIVAVARREFLYRARTRAYRFTTVLLVVFGVALAMLPTILTVLQGDDAGDRIEVVVGDANPQLDVLMSLSAILNTNLPTTPTPGDDPTPIRFVVVKSDDIATARAHVLDGSTAAALALSRSANGDLRFDLYSNDGQLSRRNQLLRQAASAITIQDRLTRAGVPPVDQATLFEPPEFTLIPADPNATPSTQDPLEDTTDFLVAFGLSIAIFMAIILYGQWIAYSVAEEKNSRVMEIVLAAATPFQLLAGKVIGVGALALAQYGIVAIPTLLAVVFQGQIAALILGGDAPALGFPGGLSIAILVVFGLMLVLGFGLYATLYAGAASLVSRQEDVNNIVAPLTLISVAGYLVASYAGTGVLPLDSPLVVGMSYVPLFSPYLMLTRFGLGTAEPIEVVIAIILLALFIPVALWIAARLYRAGVLMYGQPPTPRTLWRALRSG